MFLKQVHLLECVILPRKISKPVLEPGISTRANSLMTQGSKWFDNVPDFSLHPLQANHQTEKCIRICRSLPSTLKCGHRMCDDIQNCTNVATFDRIVSLLSTCEIRREYWQVESDWVLAHRRDEKAGAILFSAGCDSFPTIHFPERTRRFWICSAQNLFAIIRVCENLMWRRSSWPSV